MSIVRLYSIYDTIAEEYGPIYEAVNEKVAIRSYISLKNRTEYPDDYELYYLGDFNRSTGEFTLNDRKIEVQVSIRNNFEELKDEQP